MICPSCKATNDDSTDACFKCGKALYSLTEGSVLSDRYKILSPLGKGGMGAVYKAYDRELEETVAVKVLRSDLAATAAGARRFRSEIKLARRVGHENVCRIHEFGREAHLCYIVMEFIEGLDLKRAIRDSGGLPVGRALDISIQVAEALRAIHKVGIVHRDLKTPNIMLDSQGNARLMDFGIAKSLASETCTGATATGQIIGTPEYMSPEQARAERIDSRSDIYAAGIVIFEIFTGELPFHGDTPLATIMKQVNEPPPLEGPAAQRIPRPLLPVLRKALAKPRDERYPTAGEMATALRQVRSRVRAVDTATATLLSTPEPADIGPETPPPTTPLPTPRPPPARPDAKATRVPPTPATRAPLPSPRSPTPVQADAHAGAAEADVPRARPRTPTPGSASPLPARLLPQQRRRTGLVLVGLMLAVAALTVGSVLLYRAMRPSAQQAAATAGRDTASALEHGAEGLAADVSAATGPRDQAAPGPADGSHEDLQRAEPSPSPRGPSTASTPSPESPARPARRRTSASAPDEAPPGNTTPARGRAVADRPHAQPTPTPPPPVPAEAEGTPVAEAVGPPAEETSPVTSEKTALRGMLQLVVVPWAEVYVDGGKVGVSPPLKPLSLDPGVHDVKLTHPSYLPLPRRVTIRAGETTRLEVDLTKEAFRR